MSPVKDGYMVDLDDALKALAEVDARKSKVVELRFFWRDERRRNCRSP